MSAPLRRRFWLDGGGALAGSGTRSLRGVLDEDDVSLTFDAARGEVTRHHGGRAEVVGDDIFTVLADSLDGSPDTHWVGCFGYASRTDLPGRPAAQTPDAIWMCARDVTFFDAERAGPPVIGSVETEEPVEAAYAAGFAEVHEQLRAGNSYEVNLTYRLDREDPADPGDPVAVYRRLRAGNPAPYAGFLEHHGTCLLSASPERYATVGRDRWIETRPIKGTTARSVDPEHDAELRRRLTEDPKIRAENLMIVDLLRNDLAMVCDPGTVEVPALMQAESYASVHQLVSTVRGRLRSEVGTVAALRAIFPAGSMTGAPKLRTMQIIDAVETTPRGLYAGAFGWISGDGRADLGVVIRSLVRTPTGAWLVGTGGGITVQSELEQEWAESRWKADRVLAALLDHHVQVVE